MGWPLKEKDLKRYPHFDAFIPLKELERLATDPEKVAKHPFLPFLLYTKGWQPFRREGQRPKRKERPIRYASRRDSAIFSYYRYLLSQHYETALLKLGIDRCPIAYRKLARPAGIGGKCNIDFAADAFAEVCKLCTCCTVTLDISSYFECIDHGRLGEVWNRLLGTSRLPPDHMAVFRAITQYAVVDRNAAYERLGYIGVKARPGGLTSTGFLTPRRAMPIQLCTPQEFRQRIAGKDKSHPSLIVKNKENYGIPQGAPISDLLANIYLLDFDVLVQNYVSLLGGIYYRYSDDIFILVPGGAEAGFTATAFIVDAIQKFGPKLKIKESKTAIVAFSPGSDGALSATRIDRPRSRSGLEYLGFRFDGRKAYLRESTMSRFHRSIKLAGRRRARMLVRRFNGHSFASLIERFRVEDFESRFGRIAGFEHCLQHQKWTFRTYIKRCSAVFGDTDGTFFRQMRRHREFIIQVAGEEIRKALVKHPSETKDIALG